MTRSRAVIAILALAVVGAVAAFMFVGSTPKSVQFSDLSMLRDSRIQDLELRLEVFRDWKEVYNKVYDPLEEHYRFKVWNDNYDFVQRHNAQNLSWEVEMNQFADLTTEEFGALYTGFNAQAAVMDETEVTVIDEEELKQVPASWDWRDKGAVSTWVRNQGSCGSCYAFASLSALESLWKIKKGTYPNLSEQQIVDCSSSYGNQGCEGGLMTNTYRYTAAKGVQRETTYRYETRVGSCRYSASKATYKHKGHTNVPERQPEQLKAALYKQPVAVAVEAYSQGFQMYKSGVLSSGCGTSLDHAVTAVGYGTSGGNPFWVIKNSWGKSWGENGYVRIKRGSDLSGAGICGVNLMATYPTM